VRARALRLEMMSSGRQGASPPTRQRGVDVRAARNELVAALGAFVDRAIDRVLLTGERVSSAAEGKRLLATRTEAEARAERIQRLVVAGTPVVRRLARGARFTRVPWVMVASSSIAIGIVFRTGVRELQVLASLVAQRLEQETGVPAEPALVKKVTIGLYLNPKRIPDLADTRLHLGRLIRRWVLSGAFGRNTSSRAQRALEAAERLDATELSARWAATHPTR